MIMKYITRQ